MYHTSLEPEQPQQRLAAVYSPTLHITNISLT